MMKLKNQWALKKPALTSIAAFCCMSMMTPSVFGQETINEDGARVLEELIVTARKRDETLLDIPLSVSVVDSALIETANIISLDDLARTTPGFKVNSAFGRQGDRPVLRGVSAIAAGLDLAGFFVDGVFVSGTLQSYDLSAIERVEILKGPQSTAFGRRTFAGAINYVTSLPDDESKTKLKANIGSNGLTDFGLTFSGKAGNVGYRVNLRDYSYDGDFDNVLAAGPQDIGSEGTRSFNGTLYFNPSENTSVRANLVYEDNDDGQYGIALQDASANNATFGRSEYFVGEIDGSTPVSLGGVFPAGDYGVQQERLLASVQIDHDFGNVEFSSITSYGSVENFSIQDQTFSGRTNVFSFSQFRPVPILADGNGFHSVSDSETTNFSQEFWLRGSAIDDRLSWATGLYYFDEEQLDLEVGGGRDDIQNTAIMMSVDYEFSDHFSAGLELRYAEDDIQQTLDGSGQLFEETFESTTYRATASWKLSDDTLIYGSASTGVLPGQFNTDSRLPAELIPVDEGELEQFELGVKSSINNRLELTAAVYTQEWKNQIRSQFIVLGGTPVSFAANEGTTDFTGFEFSAKWLASDRLTLTGSLALNDSEVNDFVSADTTDIAITGDGNVSGAQAPLSADSEAYLSAAYNFPVSSNYDLTTRVDWSYQASRFARLVNLAETGSSSVINASLTLTKSDADWRISLWGKNLTDEDAPVSILRYIESDSFFFGGRAFAFTPRRGAEFGITGTYEF